MRSVDAARLFEPEEDLRESLERAIAGALFDGGVWSSPRQSDGVASYRVIEQSPSRIRICGKIWTIDQTLHLFYVDVERRDGADGPGWHWDLHFDIDIASSGKGATNRGMDAIRAPDDVTWVVNLSGGDRRRDSEHST